MKIVTSMKQFGQKIDKNRLKETQQGSIGYLYPY